MDPPGGGISVLSDPRTRRSWAQIIVRFKWHALGVTIGEQYAIQRIREMFEQVPDDVTLCAKLLELIADNGIWDEFFAALIDIGLPQLANYFFHEVQTYQSLQQQA